MRQIRSSLAVAVAVAFLAVSSTARAQQASPKVDVGGVVETTALTGATAYLNGIGGYNASRVIVNAIQPGVFVGVNFAIWRLLSAGMGAGLAYSLTKLLVGTPNEDSSPLRHAAAAGAPKIAAGAVLVASYAGGIGLGAVAGGGFGIVMLGLAPIVLTAAGIGLIAYGGYQGWQAFVAHRETQISGSNVARPADTLPAAGNTGSAAGAGGPGVGTQR